MRRKQKRAANIAATAAAAKWAAEVVDSTRRVIAYRTHTPDTIRGITASKPRRPRFYRRRSERIRARRPCPF